MTTCRVAKCGRPMANLSPETLKADVSLRGIFILPSTILVFYKNPYLSIIDRRSIAIRRVLLTSEIS